MLQVSKLLSIADNAAIAGLSTNALHYLILLFHLSCVIGATNINDSYVRDLWYRRTAANEYREGNVSHKRECQITLFGRTA